MKRSDASTSSTAAVTLVVDAVEVEVVHDQRALVAEVAVVLELHGAGHGAKSTGRRRRNRTGKANGGRRSTPRSFD